MPAILLYLIKVNVALLLFCLGYYAVLRRLTFYTLNRVYLIIAIVFSTLYPTINFSGIVEQHQQLTKPLQIIIIDFDARATQYIHPVEQTNYWHWLVLIFWAGVGVMLLRLLIQLTSLYKLYRRAQPADLLGHPVRLITDKTNPFSFWQSIYINPHQHREEELSAIIAHEQIHVKQWHTLDILLAELSLIFYWFNPGVWFIKKAISENLEFITDREILRKGTDAKSYQYSLLYTSFNTSPNAMVNHFNLSTIKKRIIMMNAKKSSAFSLTRYSFIFPCVLALLLAFGTSKAAFVNKGFNLAKSASRQVITLAQNAITVKENSTATPAQNDTTPKKQISSPSSTDTGLTMSIKESNFSTDTERIKRNFSLSMASLDSTYFVVDGKPVSAQQFKNINPNDIASINLVSADKAEKAFNITGFKNVIAIFTKKGEHTDTAQKLLQKLNTHETASSTSSFSTIRIVPSQNSASSFSISSGTPDKTKSTFSTGNGTINTTSDSSKTAKVTVTGSSSLVARGTGFIVTSDAKDTTKTSPLLVIDGKPIQASNKNEMLNEIQKYVPDDIETITIVKDAAATAIYGDRGKYGVVLITTKHGAKKQ
jgi:bla regulator protein BlaR1